MKSFFFAETRKVGSGWWARVIHKQGSQETVVLDFLEDELIAQKIARNMNLGR